MANDQFSNIRPKALKKNSLIALIAPAGPIHEVQVAKAQETFAEMGFGTCFTNRIFERRGYLAGSDKSRLDDLHEAFENKKVDAIICIRGGYGSSRIIQEVNFNLIKQNPKIFIGYSDITALLNTIWQKTGLVTYHGLVGISSFSTYTREIFTQLISGQLADNKIFTADESQFVSISPGKAEGRLVGGNLSIISSLIGTSYDIDFSNKIVFLEDVNEAPYKIDRMLTHLLLSGKLQRAAGIILGDFKGCDIDNKEITYENSLSLNEVFHDRLANLGIPVSMGFSFGHIENQALFPIGIKCLIDTDRPEIQLLEDSVK